MDNITHSLTGLALARAGFNRFCPHATALLILSANAPDVDIIMAARGALPYFEAHRGYTHCLLGLPVMAGISVLVTAAIFRQRLPWLRAWALCCIGVASHLLLDWTNSYGIRLLIPFSSRWFHLDINSLYDGAILPVLVFAALWPLFSRLVSGEIGDRPASGRGSAIFALVFFLLFDCGRALMHERAVAQLESRLYHEMPPIQTAALPDRFNPLRWTGIVESSGSYEVLDLNALSQLNVETAETFYKPPVTPALQSASRLEPFRYFRYFARFPLWSVQPVFGEDAQRKRVELTDLRFGTPGAGSFHSIALEDDRNQVIASWFTFGSGSNLGWGGNNSRP